MQMSNVHFHRTLHALQMLMENSSERQIWMDEEGDANPGRVDFVKEFCTIRIQGPRQTGHTSVCKELIAQFGEGNTLLVTPNKFSTVYDGIQNIASPESIDDFRGHDFQIVVVDQYSYIRPDLMEEIFRVYSPFGINHVPFFMVLLG